MKWNTTLPLILGILLVSLITPAMGAINNMGDAINKAGRQRMLTQRMVKAYCMIGQNVNADESKKELDSAVSLFDNQLNELKQYHVNDDISNALKTVDQEWHKYKSMVTATPSQEQAGMLRDQAETVLQASHKVVVMLEKASGSSTGRLVNLAGRQRMLSQRMASHYLLQSWGLKDTKYSETFTTAMQEFHDALHELEEAPENTPDIVRAIKKVKTQFAMLEYSAKSTTGEYMPLTIATATGKLLVLMNDITGMYAALPVR